MQVNGGIGDLTADAAEADFGLVVSVWSAGRLRTWMACQERGRTPVNASVVAWAPAGAVALGGRLDDGTLGDSDARDDARHGAWSLPPTKAQGDGALALHPVERRKPLGPERALELMCRRCVLAHHPGELTRA